jgi:hypothetical protein
MRDLRSIAQNAARHRPPVTKNPRQIRGMAQTEKKATPERMAQTARQERRKS